ncbi:MAG: hypothetical protein HYU64_20330 [Armatimonadetes bacterium]|nr:hypothetical protein [Armatimonadota bacterium]
MLNSVLFQPRSTHQTAYPYFDTPSGGDGGDVYFGKAGIMGISAGFGLPPAATAIITSAVNPAAGFASALFLAPVLGYVPPKLLLLSKDIYDEPDTASILVRSIASSLVASYATSQWGLLGGLAVAGGMAAIGALAQAAQG